MTIAPEMPWWSDPAELVASADIEPGKLLTARIRAARPAWMSSAACRGHDVNIFHPTRGQSSDPAKQVCTSCPVLAQCRTWGLGQPDHGVIGGLSGKQRRRLRARGRS